MSEAVSSIRELTEQLLVMCSNNKVLRDVSENQIKEMIATLVRFQFSDDNRKNAQANLNKTITRIVDDMFLEGSN